MTNFQAIKHQGRFFVGYETAGFPIKTAVCECTTMQQAEEEATRLNSIQAEKAQALVTASEDRAMRLMHPLGSI